MSIAFTVNDSIAKIYSDEYKVDVKVVRNIPLLSNQTSFKKISKENGKACLFLRPLYFAGAYILTQEGAQKMLAMSHQVLYPADRLPNQARIKKGMICRGYVPSIVHQDRDSFTSNIVV